MLQDLKDIEVIIVNDGSTDNSISNIQNIIKNKENIHLINKVKGVSLQLGRRDYCMQPENMFCFLIVMTI